MASRGSAPPLACAALAKRNPTKKFSSRSDLRELNVFGF
jgi:hypothetical protein